ncbi:hypothetical protein [Nitrosospira sp. Nsp13]|uniref:hypothetical protein n=1 Tax=Nitrosospira sp. Nsp13 TaxID=1855332 RepID=UPI000890974B|nr:hypothetical protein [Nitrosospira sp. Nsp13]SCX98347.1 hypothetical protein SAMN05216308_102265 [Nitrosospira sp. Nsp13]
MGNFSNYPNGFNRGVSIRGIPILNTYSGNTYWVDSRGASNGEGTFQRPFVILQLALNACTASKGDMIIIKAGHAETISSATMQE